VPFIGRLNLLSRRIHVATGFKKWGMTAGTLAGMLLTDAITGRPNAWAPMFASTRIRPVAEARRFTTENGRVGLRMVAGYRDESGALHAVSARCTHLGCQVAWNDAEHTWDCPCHGSRFRPDGAIIEGPATRPLDPRDLP
jgi:nitrite reductase/ring-hydroxylating ferredoxin subunit